MLGLLLALRLLGFEGPVSRLLKRIRFSVVAVADLGEFKKAAERAGTVYYLIYEGGWYCDLETHLQGAQIKIGVRLPEALGIPEEEYRRYTPEGRERVIKEWLREVFPEVDLIKVERFKPLEIVGRVTAVPTKPVG